MKCQGPADFVEYQRHNHHPLKKVKQDLSAKWSCLTGWVRWWLSKLLGFPRQSKWHGTEWSLQEQREDSPSPGIYTRSGKAEESATFWWARHDGDISYHSVQYSLKNTTNNHARHTLINQKDHYTLQFQGTCYSRTCVWSFYENAMQNVCKACTIISNRSQMYFYIHKTNC